MQNQIKSEIGRVLCPLFTDVAVGLRINKPLVLARKKCFFLNPNVFSITTKEVVSENTKNLAALIEIRSLISVENVPHKLCQ